jgi:hypothetical protein
MSSDFFLIEPCSSANGLEIKFRGRNIDLKKLSFLIEKEGGFSGASTAVVLLAKIDDFEISAYASGRIMVKSKTKNKKQISDFCTNFAKNLYESKCLI